MTAEMQISLWNIVSPDLRNVTKKHVENTFERHPWTNEIASLNNNVII